MEGKRNLKVVHDDDEQLHLVDRQSGEVIAECPHCVEKDRAYAELERKYRGSLTQIGNMRADKIAAAEAHQQWPEAIALWWEWKIATNRMGPKWSSDRFWLCQPFLAGDGWHICRFAVWGIAAHPNEKWITKGYAEVYNDWELLFRNRGTFERYANRGAAIFGYTLPIDTSEWGVK